MSIVCNWRQQANLATYLKYNQISLKEFNYNLICTLQREGM